MSGPWEGLPLQDSDGAVFVLSQEDHISLPGWMTVYEGVQTEQLGKWDPIVTRKL